MRRIYRTALSQDTLDKLLELSNKVTGDAAPAKKANALWRAKPKKCFDEVRVALEAMASGRSRCMYCEDSLGTDIDHFRPKATFPHLAFSWPNYLMACSHCNSNLKGRAFPVDATGNALLIDPSVDDPVDHLELTLYGDFVPVGAKGPQSIMVFALNDDTSPRRLPTGRHQALVGLVALLKDYDREVATNLTKAALIRATIKDYPFSAVLHWLVRVSHAPAGPNVLGASLVALIHQHQVHTWL